MKKSLLSGLGIILLAGLIFSPASSAAASNKSGDTAWVNGVPAGRVNCSESESPIRTETPALVDLPTVVPVVLEGASPESVVEPEVKIVEPPFQAGGISSDVPVKVETFALSSTYLDGTERIAQVYLPGDYAQNPEQRFPVLYAFDGQQLPQIGFEQTLNGLFASGEVTPFIVVAVFSTEGDLRRQELGAGPNINMLGWGIKSDAFNHFVIDEWVPEINRAYRTLPGAQNTAVMGWSLGGLTSFYLAWQYPDTFGIVGAFSPSFWWRTGSLPGEELQARVIPNLVRSSTDRPGLRMWFEAGTKELPYSDVDGNGVIDMIQDVQDMMSLLAQKGYQVNSDRVYVEVAGGQHELSTWETVLPDFLKFAFAPEL